MAYADLNPPVPEALPAAQQAQIKGPTDKWTDKYALSIVSSDWAYAESYRVNAHDWRYRNADELYLAWAGQNYWEGTRVPRSSLGVYVTFEQIQAMLAKTVPAVTAMDQWEWKLASPPTQDNEHNRLIIAAWREMVISQLNEVRFRQQVRRALHSMKQNGNGVLEVGYEDYEEEYISFDKAIRLKSVNIINHPINGPTPVPGQTEENFTRKIKRDRKTRPYVRYVSMKDLYVDPNLETPDIQDAGYVIKRVYMRAEQIKALRNSKDFNIPNDEQLTQLSKAKSTANQDVTKLSAELFRYNMWNPSQDYTSDPAQKRIAVVEYTKKDRKIWWLQGINDEWGIIYNQPNRYGCINFFNCSYADVLDRWYALSVCDVTEGEQRLQQALTNSRIDEVALALHPPTYKRRGITVPWYQLKRAPGRVTEVENPESDVKQAEIMNVTQSAYVEVQASENRVQKITGMTDLAALGTPSSGGNSANRTATGVNTQAGATQDRMSFILENIEDDMIEKVVNSVLKFNRKFMDLKQAANWLKITPKYQQLDPLEVMNARITVDCRTSARMRGKTGFMQAFPMLMQTYLNPELVQLWQQTHGKTLDPSAMEDTLWDAIGYRPKSPWFIDMTDQQKKAMNQPPPEVMAQLQMQQNQLQNDQQIDGQRGQVKLIDTVLKGGFDHHAQMAQMDDDHMHQQQQLAADLAMHQSKLDAEKEKAKMQAQAAKNRPKPNASTRK